MDQKQIDYIFVCLPKIKRRSAKIDIVKKKASKATIKEL